MDWLSWLFEMMPVRGRLDLRCSYGAPWRIDQGPGEANEIPYHAVLAGSATLEDPAGGSPLQLTAGQLSAAPPRRACRRWRRKGGDCHPAQGPRLLDTKRVRKRSPGRTGDAERAVKRDVRPCAAPCQRDRRCAAWPTCIGRTSAFGARSGSAIQRARARLVVAQACAIMQHVTRDARPAIPGEARKIGQRSPDRHPDDARRE